jgi:uncharacterized protein (DUF1330 family)
LKKAYTIVAYRSIGGSAAFAAYAELAGPAIRAAGGRCLVRGLPTATFEAGLQERIVIVEYDSVEQAVAGYKSEAYGKALAVLGPSTERDIRIVESLD